MEAKIKTPECSGASNKTHKSPGPKINPQIISKFLGFADGCNYPKCSNTKG